MSRLIPAIATTRGVSEMTKMRVLIVETNYREVVVDVADGDDPEDWDTYKLGKYFLQGRESGETDYTLDDAQPYEGE